MDIGAAAKSYLEELICYGSSRGTLVIDILNKRDKYGRYLVDITVDGESVGALMTQYGLAVPYSGGKKRRFCSCA